MKSYNISTDGFDPDVLNQTPDKKANNKRTNNKKQEQQASSIINFFKDKRTHVFLGILLLVIAVYLLIVSISFFNTGDADQSKILNNGIAQISTQSGAVKNAGGPLGAYISNLLMTEWLGIGSFILIFYVAAIGATLIKLYKFKFWSLTFKCLILSITISMVSGLMTLESTSSLFIGGKHGYYTNKYLLDMTGFWGMLAVNIVLIALVILIYFNDICNIYLRYRKAVDARKEQQRQERETKEAEKAKVEESLRNSIIGEQESFDKHPEDDELLGFDEMSEQINDDNPHSFTINEDEYNELPNDSEPEPNPEITIGGDVEMSVTAPVIEQATEINTDIYDPTAELSRYKFPSIDLLHERVIKENSVDQQEQEENKERITKTLNDYGIPISHIKATVGPTVTLYEIIPAEGVRIAKIKRLEDDIALSLAALGIRIIAPIPGKGTIGIEVPNKEPQTVSIRSIISSKKYQECKHELPMAMGSTISNDVFIADLAKMPHLLVAGATGMGKSVGLNTIITSLLYKKHPAELKFVLIDPKMVEFSLYSKLERHYLAKLPDEEEAIITDPLKVVATLNSLCVEMDNRYNLLRDANVRSIKEYNAKFTAKRLNPEKGHRYLPYIVVIVDEFADLIMTAGKEVETPIARIAQKARAVGMHMIIATQRPSTNVITGIIKANFPGRVAFRVTQMVDSKTILDRSGANQLIGRGDLLFSRDGEMDRVQCAFIDTDEVESICECIDEQIGYDHAYLLPEYIPESGEGGGMGNIADKDVLFEEAARFIVTSQTASTSSLQRRYSIGYNRAGKIMDQMEAAGIVGPSQGGKPRQVLVDSLQLERIIEMM